MILFIQVLQVMGKGISIFTQIHATIRIPVNNMIYNINGDGDWSYTSIPTYDPVG
ncbi:MAG: hypothetical protein R3A12_07050 [Ignavibacteria bacterium]